MAERVGRFTDPELERALVDLGGRIAYPPTPDLAAAVRRRVIAAPRQPAIGWRIRAVGWLARPPARVGLVAAVLALVLALGALLAFVPGARTAVADRLGLRGVTIEQVPAVPTATATPSPTPSPTPPPTGTPAPSPLPTATPAPVGERLGLGQRLTLAQAQARVSFPILTPTLPGLGAPDEVYLGDQPVGGQVALVYGPRPGVPVAGETGVGLLLTEFRGDVNSNFVPIGKEAGPDTRLETVTVNGGVGYWLTGHPHTFFYRDADGEVRNETIRLADNTLLWEQGNLTLRLESALDRDAALRIAGSVR